MCVRALGGPNGGRPRPGTFTALRALELQGLSPVFIGVTVATEVADLKLPYR